MTKIFKSSDFYNRKYWCLAVPCLVAMVALFSFHAKAQDYKNPCFFCHMNVMIEMKTEAIKHWEAGVDCEACHGASVQHMDVEDNSIKPDSVWTDNNVYLLCRRCHDLLFSDYNKSAHAKWLFNPVKEEIKKAPSCITCHGYHGLKTNEMIREVCLGCHHILPKTCDLDSLKKGSQEKLMTCKSCHVIHSLDLVKKENSSKPARRP